MIDRPRLSVLLAALALATSACSGGDDDDDGATAPEIVSVSPADGIPGTNVTITGSRFGDEQGISDVFFGDAAGAIVSWTDTVIVATVTDAAYPGDRPVVVQTDDGGPSEPFAFRVTLPRALYVHDDASPANVIEAFGVASDGALTPLAGSPHVLDVASAGFGGYPDLMALHAGTRRLFTTAEGSVQSWDVDPRTGALTSAGSLSLGAGTYPYDIAANAAGTRIFTAEYEIGEVHVADVAADGTLSATAGSPFPAMIGLASLELSHSGNWLLLNNENESAVHSLAVAADGGLTEVAGSPFPIAGFAYHIALAPDADRLYVASIGSGAILVLDVDETDGSLAENIPLREPLEDVQSIAFDAAGSRLFAVDGFTLFVFDVAADGSLTPAGTELTVGTGSANGVKVSADGTLAFVLDESDVEVGVFTIANDGTPTEVGSSPTSLSTGDPSGMAVSF